MTRDDARTRLSAAIVRLGAGDKSALEVVYRATSAKLFGICLRILNDRGEAEDALQDVYVSLWRRANRYDPLRASPISWLATFARNRAIDRLRTGKARRHDRPLADASFVADSAPRTDDVLIADEGSARILLCIDALKPLEKSAIKTAFFEGRTYAELASSADVALGTMKSRIRRALAKLRTCLDGAE